MRHSQLDVLLQVFSHKSSISAKMQVSDFASTCAFRLCGQEGSGFSGSLGLCTSLQVLSASWFVHCGFDSILLRSLDCERVLMVLFGIP